MGGGRLGGAVRAGGFPRDWEFENGENMVVRQRGGTGRNGESKARARLQHLLGPRWQLRGQFRPLQGSFLLHY
eukprot:5000079-Pyramimonas_sp.AAC.1